MGVAARSPFLLTLRAASPLPSGRVAPRGQAGGRALPRLPSPSRFPGGGEPRGQLPPAPLRALCRPPASALGEGSREALEGAPAPLPLPGNVSWARSPLAGRLRSLSALCTPDLEGREKVKGFAGGRGGGKATFKCLWTPFFQGFWSHLPRAPILKWLPSPLRIARHPSNRLENLEYRDFSVLRIRL